ncbi:MAG TPA: hypothetical protein VIO94_15990 [Phenylobacterium sp.]
MFDDLIPDVKGGSLSFDDLIAPNRKTEGYRKARAKVESLDKLRRDNSRGVMNAVNDFTSQVARNTGAFDEVAGGINYALQGGENFVRRMTGRPVDISAADAATAAIDFERAEQARIAKERPILDALATGAGFVTSARPTGGAMIRNPVGAGAAAALQNAPFAVARQEGSVRERLPGALKETAVVAGTAGLMTAGANRLGHMSARAARADPSPQRQLSAQGVDLTPGQMMGGVARRTEDAMTSIPVLGDSIRAAKTRGIESFNRAALDRTLDPIGEALPAGVNVGREGVREATQRISGAYDNALSGVTVAPDRQLSQDIAAVVNNADLPPNVQAELDGVINNTLAARMTGQVDGQTWKAIDSELASAVRAADNASASQPSQRYLRDALQAVRQAHQGLLERASPEAFAAVRAADEATANLARIRQASQYTGTSAREGVFTPADLNRAVQGMDTSAGNRAFARGDALMQDLTEPAMRVLPSTVPDSGTPLRSLMTAGGIGGWAAAAGHPTMAAVGMTGIAGGSALYSRPVQAALNAIYRATSPGQATQALATLQALAARDPALAPVYREAAAALGVPINLPVERPMTVGVQ